MRGCSRPGCRARDGFPTRRRATLSATAGVQQLCVGRRAPRASVAGCSARAGRAVARSARRSHSGARPCRRLPPARVASMEVPGASDEGDSYIDQLRAKFQIDGFVEFHEGPGGLPVCYLLHPRGHSVEVHLAGANVTRWLRPNGANLLFVRPDARFEPGVPLNSGTPLAFPQWRDGELPDNGFAGLFTWEVVETDLGFELPDLDGEDLRGGVELLEKLVAAETGRGAYVSAEALADAEGGAELRAEVEAELLRPLPEAAAAELLPPPPEDAGDADAPGSSGGGADEGAEEAARAQSEGEGGGGEDDDDEDDGDDGGEGEADLARILEATVADPAPFVVLRLAANSETRRLWPHSFEVRYKITLSETDAFPDPREGLPMGNIPVESGADLGVGAIPFWKGDATVTDVEADAGDGDSGEGASEGASSEGGEDWDPRDGELDEGQEHWGPRVTGNPDDLPDQVDPFPLQLKMEVDVTHTGAPDDPPFDFQLALLPHLATQDQNSPLHGPFVRVLGLGGTQTFNYGYDPRFPVLDMVEDDYVYFGGSRVEMVGIKTAAATVKFCPGDRTHFELLQRGGVRDSVLEHPGPVPPAGTELFAPYYAVLGAGRVAIPYRLAPGEVWSGAYVLRYREHPWEPPIFDRSAAPPLPELEPGEEDEDEEEA